MLTVPWRQGQQLSVETDRLPRLTSAAAWLETMTIVFTARQIPWWQSTAPTVASASQSSSGTLALSPAGTAPLCPVDCRFTLPVPNPAAITIGGITLTTSGKSCTAVNFTHLPSGIMVITDQSGTDLRHLRTAQSREMLTAVPGRENLFRFSASTPVDVELSCFGWYE